MKMGTYRISHLVSSHENGHGFEFIGSCSNINYWPYLYINFQFQLFLTVSCLLTYYWKLWNTIKAFVYGESGWLSISVVNHRFKSQRHITRILTSQLISKSSLLWISMWCMLFDLKNSWHLGIINSLFFNTHFRNLLLLAFFDIWPLYSRTTNGSFAFSWVFAVRQNIIIKNIFFILIHKPY